MVSKCKGKNAIMNKRRAGTGSGSQMVDRMQLEKVRRINMEGGIGIGGDSEEVMKDAMNKNLGGWGEPRYQYGGLRYWGL